MNKPQKYNFGFGWFGPLEACDNGKFYKAEDMDGYIHCVETALNAKSAELREVSQNLIDTKSQLGECRLEVDTLELTITELEGVLASRDKKLMSHVHASAEADKKILRLSETITDYRNQTVRLEQQLLDADTKHFREEGALKDKLSISREANQRRSKHNFWLTFVLLWACTFAMVEGILLWT